MLESESSALPLGETAIFFLRCDFGWDRWIRTTGMTESKSAALPLGYIPVSISLISEQRSTQLLYYSKYVPKMQVLFQKNFSKIIFVVFLDVSISIIPFFSVYLKFPRCLEKSVTWQLSAHSAAAYSVPENCLNEKCF